MRRPGTMYGYSVGNGEKDRVAWTGHGGCARNTIGGCRQSFRAKGSRLVCPGRTACGKGIPPERPPPAEKARVFADVCKVFSVSRSFLCPVWNMRCKISGCFYRHHMQRRCASCKQTEDAVYTQSQKKNRLLLFPCGCSTIKIRIAAGRGGTFTCTKDILRELRRKSCR